MDTKTSAVLVTLAFSIVGVVGDYFLKRASQEQDSLRTPSFYLGFTLYAAVLQIPGVTDWLVEQFADPSGIGRVIMAAMRLVAIGLFAYMIFIVVAVWRSAANFTGPRHWSWLVRACMVFYLISVVARCVGTPAA